MVDKTKEYNGKCMCPLCPSYVDCKERAFCLDSVGKSKCIKLEKGCLCGGCPVHMELKFKYHYYCTKDSEKKQEKHD